MQYALCLASPPSTIMNEREVSQVITLNLIYKELINLASHSYNETSNTKLSRKL